MSAIGAPRACMCACFVLPWVPEIENPIWDGVPLLSSFYLPRMPVHPPKHTQTHTHTHTHTLTPPTHAETATPLAHNLDFLGTGSSRCLCATSAG